MGWCTALVKNLLPLVTGHTPADDLVEPALEQAHWVLPMPLSAARLRMRGFNQALLLARHLVLGTSISEMRFGATDLRPGNYLILTGLFALNALVFVSVGQQMGVLFDALPRLQAYAWDLGGSLCGTLCAGLFSLQYFSPMTGMARSSRTTGGRCSV